MVASPFCEASARQVFAWGRPLPPFFDASWTWRGSNPLPRRCERRALPVELQALVFSPVSLRGAVRHVDPGFGAVRVSAVVARGIVWATWRGRGVGLRVLRDRRVRSCPVAWGVRRRDEKNAGRLVGRAGVEPASPWPFPSSPLWHCRFRGGVVGVALPRPLRPAVVNVRWSQAGCRRTSPRMVSHGGAIPALGVSMCA